jgi:hypothetical protein
MSLSEDKKLFTENDFVCSFFGGERKKNDVPSLEIGEKFGAKSGRKNPKDKMRQYEKNQVKQDGKKINNTSQKSPQLNAHVPHFDNIQLTDWPIFMDDNARPHRACIIREFRQQEAIDTFQWPVISSIRTTFTPKLPHSPIHSTI